MFQEIRKRFPHATLVLAGGGADADAFKAALAESDIGESIKLLGWVSPEQIEAEYRKSDVFVFPSYAEGMPNALLEAIVAGVPVVSTDVGAIPDAVANGVTGRLFHPGDVQTFTQHVSAALEQPVVAAEMAAEARRRVAERFDVERVWRVYARALNRAAYEAGRRPAILLFKRAQGVSSACAGS
jgi:glycosyltransferase involved in cell wall biosynthesis